MKPVVLVVLLLAPTFAGCIGPSGVSSDPFAIDLRRPGLPEPVAIEGGEVTFRNVSTAILEWRGRVAPGGLATPATDPGWNDAPAETTQLHLPGGVALRVEVTLEWAGGPNLDLEMHDAEGDRCVHDTAEGRTSGSPGALEACTAPWADARPEGHAWSIVVSAPDGLVEEVPFHVTVGVTSLPEPPRYDLAAGPRLDATVPDPAQAGPGRVMQADYDFGTLIVEDPVTRRPYPVRVLGSLHFAEPLEGHAPVVVFLHGRHDSCHAQTYGVLAFDGGWTSHCRGTAPAAEAVPSHRGYDDVAALLASHGYVVASIDANDINALDSPSYLGMSLPRGDDGLTARATLILRTLDELRAVHEGTDVPSNPELAPLAGHLDLSRLGLMGHSRGAEAVTHTPGFAKKTGHWSADAYAAVYSLAGARRLGLPGYETPIVTGPTAYASVIPYCDGDISGLNNAEFHDVYAARGDHGPLTQLVFMGANHNGYNSEWHGDDAVFAWRGDPYCRPDETEDGPGYGRLSPGDQRRHQLAYLSAFFRQHLGGESAFAPLFTGSASPPPSACPEGLTACPGLVHVSYHPPAGERLLVEDTASREALTTNDLGGASTFRNFDRVSWCDPFGDGSGEGEPCVRPRTVGAASRLALSWTQDAVWRTTLPADADLGAFDTLAFRVAVGDAEREPLSTAGAAPPRLRVTLEDASGARATVDAREHTTALFMPPGLHASRLVLNQVRIPFNAFVGVDPAGVRAIELRFDGATPGAVQVAELMAFRSAGTEGHA